MGHISDGAAVRHISCSVAVGHDEDAPSQVGRAGVGSAHHERPAGVAQCFQPGADPVRAADAQSRAVLSHHPTGSQFGDEALHLVPEAAAGAAEAAALSGGADILAGETPADEVGGADAVRAQALGGKPAHVVVERDAGPVPGEDAAALGVALAEGDGVHSRPVQAEAEAADAAEQVKDAHGGGAEAWRAATVSRPPSSNNSYAAAWRGPSLVARARRREIGAKALGGSPL